MTRFFDPTPIIEKNAPTTTGVVSTGADVGEAAVVKFRGKTIAGPVIGAAVAAGDHVSVIWLSERNGGQFFVVPVALGYPTTFPRKLIEWGPKKRASIAMRQLLKDNPRSMKYRPILITAFDDGAHVAAFAAVGDRFPAGVAPVRLGEDNAVVSVGGTVLLFSSVADRHIIGLPEDLDPGGGGGGGGGGGSEVPPGYVLPAIGRPLSVARKCWSTASYNNSPFGASKKASGVVLSADGMASTMGSAVWPSNGPYPHICVGSGKSALVIDASNDTTFVHETAEGSVWRWVSPPSKLLKAVSGYFPYAGDALYWSDAPETYCGLKTDGTICFFGNYHYSNDHISPLNSSIPGQITGSVIDIGSDAYGLTVLTSEGKIFEISEGSSPTVTEYSVPGAKRLCSQPQSPMVAYLDSDGKARFFRTNTTQLVRRYDLLGQAVITGDPCLLAFEPTYQIYGNETGYVGIRADNNAVFYFNFPWGRNDPPFYLTMPSYATHVVGGYNTWLFRTTTGVLKSLQCLTHLADINDVAIYP